MADGTGAAPPDVIVRRPTEADHARLARAVDTWWGERGRGRLPRLWLRHFGGTSWLAESPAGSPVALLVGFLSPDDPGTAVLHLVTTIPARRRRGVARDLVARFVLDARERGARRIEAVVWPGNPGGIAFLRAIGFAAVDSAGGPRLYGWPAIADYDGEGEDRSIFECALPTVDVATGVSAASAAAVAAVAAPAEPRESV